jgi:hypothetical protein
VKGNPVATLLQEQLFPLLMMMMMIVVMVVMGIEGGLPYCSPVNAMYLKFP